MKQQIDLIKATASMAKSSSKRYKAGFLIAPDFFHADIMGAHTVLGTQPNTEIHLLWKKKEMIIGSPYFPTMPTTTFDECPEALDVLVVGLVAPEVMKDPEVIDFIKKQGERGCRMIGVCGGVLMLGAAGLLEGRRATSNQNCTEDLASFGAIPVFTTEVVVDGALYTAGPGHGCIEAALMVLADIRGEAAASLSELSLEYDPHPPFGGGDPAQASPEEIKLVRLVLGSTFKKCAKYAREYYEAHR